MFITPFQWSFTQAFSCLTRLLIQINHFEQQSKIIYYEENHYSSITLLGELLLKRNSTSLHPSQPQFKTGSTIESHPRFLSRSRLLPVTHVSRLQAPSCSSPMPQGPVWVSPLGPCPAAQRWRPAPQPARPPAVAMAKRNRNRCGVCDMMKERRIENMVKLERGGGERKVAGNHK